VCQYGLGSFRRFTHNHFLLSPSCASQRARCHTSLSINDHQDPIALVLTCCSLMRMVIPAHVTFLLIYPHGRRCLICWTNIAFRPRTICCARSGDIELSESICLFFLPECERASNIIAVPGPRDVRTLVIRYLWRLAIYVSTQCHWHVGLPRLS
jgi:hypothetical protein